MYPRCEEFHCDRHGYWFEAPGKPRRRLCEECAQRLGYSARGTSFNDGMPETTPERWWTKYAAKVGETPETPICGPIRCQRTGPAFRAVGLLDEGGKVKRVWPNVAAAAKAIRCGVKQLANALCPGRNGMVFGRKYCWMNPDGTPRKAAARRHKKNSTRHRKCSK